MMTGRGPTITGGPTTTGSGTGASTQPAVPTAATTASAPPALRRRRLPGRNIVRPPPPVGRGWGGRYSGGSAARGKLLEGMTIRGRQAAAHREGPRPLGDVYVSPRVHGDAVGRGKAPRRG